MSKGIYCYIDKTTNKVIYIGKDSHIDKNQRHKQHHQKCNYKEQEVNQVLQNNPNRYLYKVLEEDINDKNILNELEIKYIQKFKPFFNFTAGGDGIDSETAQKFWNSEKGMKIREEHSVRFSGENNPMFGKTPWNKGIPRPQELKDRLSEMNSGEKHPQWKDHPRIVKQGIRNGKQNYGIRHNGETVLSSIYKDKLEVELQRLIEEGNNYTPPTKRYVGNRKWNTGENHHGFKNYARVRKIGTTNNNEPKYGLIIPNGKSCYSKDKKHLDNLCEKYNQGLIDSEEVYRLHKLFLEETKPYLNREYKKKEYARIRKGAILPNNKRNFILIFPNGKQISSKNKEYLEDLCKKYNDKELTIEEIILLHKEYVKKNRPSFPKEKSAVWKIMPRILKNGSRGFKIRHNGKILTSSKNKEKLEHILFGIIFNLKYEYLNNYSD